MDEAKKKLVEATEKVVEARATLTKALAEVELAKANLATIKVEEEAKIEEEWRDIVGYEGLYQVSNLGRVKSLDRWILKKNGVKQLYKGCMLKQDEEKREGRPRVFLNKHDKQQTIRVHRLVAEAFCPNPKNKPEVHHINGDKKDNRAVNLMWVDRVENMKGFLPVQGKHPVRGVFEDEKNKRFCAVINDRPKHQLKVQFCYGPKSNRTREEAEQLAIAQRQKWAEEFGYHS